MANPQHVMPGQRVAEGHQRNVQPHIPPSGRNHGRDFRHNPTRQVRLPGNQIPGTDRTTRSGLFPSYPDRTFVHGCHQVPGTDRWRTELPMVFPTVVYTPPPVTTTYFHESDFFVPDYYSSISSNPVVVQHRRTYRWVNVINIIGCIPFVGTLVGICRFWYSMLATLAGIIAMMLGASWGGKLVRHGLEQMARSCFEMIPVFGGGCLIIYDVYHRP